MDEKLQTVLKAVVTLAGLLVVGELTREDKVDQSVLIGLLAGGLFGWIVLPQPGGKLPDAGGKAN